MSTVILSRLCRKDAPLRSIPESEKEAHDQKAQVEVFQDDVNDVNRTKTKTLILHCLTEDNLERS